MFDPKHRRRPRPPVLNHIRNKKGIPRESEIHAVGIRGAGAGENKPVNKIGNRRAHGVDVKLPDHKSGGLRVWSGRAVIRNTWDVFFG